METARIESHTEEEVKVWFKALNAEKTKRNIDSGKKMLNMDETGVRVGCPAGEHIVVPVDVSEAFTPTQGSRKTVTILETIRGDGKNTLPPFIIAPGEKLMRNWVSARLTGDEYITCTTSGYIDNNTIMQYGEHLIKHSHAGPNKPWKILLLDGHQTHHLNEFKLLLLTNNISPFYYPSHLTHALQPLDVGVFRPWKHYHSHAVNSALRSLDFEYSITSLFRDMTQIRQSTMKCHTIRNAYKHSGMWPTSMKQGLKKLRSFGKGKKEKGKNKRVREEEEEEEDDEGDDVDLPLLRSEPQQLHSTATALDSLLGKDPTQFSDNTKQFYHETIKEAMVHIQKSYLTSIEYHTLQKKQRIQKASQRTGRKSIHNGGAAGNVADLRFMIKAKADKEKMEHFERASRALRFAISRHTKSLKTAGIAARKTNKIRKPQRLLWFQANRPPFLLPCRLEDERQPDKEPTVAEQVLLTNEGYPGLFVSMQEARLDTNQEDRGSDVEVFCGTTQDTTVIDHRQFMESSPPFEPLIEESSEYDSDGERIDPIRSGQDYILL